MVNRWAILMMLSLALLTGCKHEHVCNTPIGDANCRIEPNSPLYHGLNVVGGYEYLVGGHKGLIVVRTSYDEFVCYERTCPNDHDTPVNVSSDWGSSVLECPVCGSRFSTYTDGVPLDGSVTPCPLYQYSTRYDGSYLYIY